MFKSSVGNRRIPDNLVPAIEDALYQNGRTRGDFGEMYLMVHRGKHHYIANVYLCLMDRPQPAMMVTNLHLHLDTHQVISVSHRGLKQVTEAWHLFRGIRVTARPLCRLWYQQLGKISPYRLGIAEEVESYRNGYVAMVHGTHEKAEEGVCVMVGCATPVAHDRYFCDVHHQYFHDHGWNPEQGLYLVEKAREQTLVPQTPSKHREHFELGYIHGQLTCY